MSERGLGRIFRPTYRDRKTQKQRRTSTWWLDITKDGQRYRIPTGCRNREDAQKFRIAKLTEFGNGNGHGNGLKREALTFENLCQIIREDYKAKGRKSVISHRLKHLGKFFGGWKATDINPGSIRTYALKRRDQGAAVSSINLEIAYMSRMLHLALEAGLLNFVPPIRGLPGAKIRQGFFEPHEWEAIKAKLPAYMVPLCEFYRLTGWRRNEGIGLRWDQVDWVARTVRLEPGTTKSGAGRVLPFGADPALEAILTWQRDDGTNSAYVFHRPDGSALPSRLIDRVWRAAANAAGFTNRLIHDFRRTRVRELERAGVARSVAMALTGHKTESVYRHYAIVAEADLSAAVAKAVASRRS